MVATIVAAGYCGRAEDSLYGGKNRRIFTTTRLYRVLFPQERTSFSSALKPSSSLTPDLELENQMSPHFTSFLKT